MLVNQLNELISRYRCLAKDIIYHSGGKESFLGLRNAVSCRSFVHLNAELRSRSLVEKSGTRCENNFDPQHWIADRLWNANMSPDQRSLEEKRSFFFFSYLCFSFSDSMFDKYQKIFYNNNCNNKISNGLKWWMKRVVKRRNLIFRIR